MEALGNVVPAGKSDTRKIGMALTGMGLFFMLLG
ncbi:hypothetical protein KIPB_017090, partial [Kipferlia bialata]|eukprot:g17090.t1